jgi:steroid 5-alpha reductase family enzyme
MGLWEAAGLTLLAVLIFMTALWLVSLTLRNAGIVDVFWGPGFVLVATASLAASDGFRGRQLLATALVAMWGLRLAGHIFTRSLGHGEDFRYARWREQAGAAFWWVSYFRVFLLQGLLLWFISAPLLAAEINRNPNHFTPLDAAGALVWLVGFLFEAVADWQLARFKGDPANRGKVMRTGLWAYTRHPNYFGDATVWWGFFIIAAGTTDGWLTVFSPLIMTVLLLRISGVALLEKGIVKRRPEYADYIESTSAFVPWAPRRRRRQGPILKR